MPPARLRMVEVPIRFVDRTFGQSKMSGRISLEAVMLVLRLRFEPCHRHPSLLDVYREPRTGNKITVTGRRRRFQGEKACAPGERERSRTKSRTLT